MTDWTELQSTVTIDPAPLQHHNNTFQMSTPSSQSMKCVCKSSATFQSCSTNRFAVTTISLQAWDWTDAKAVCSCYSQKNYLSFIMMHECTKCSLTSSSNLKKKKLVFFFYQNVNSVKILMMSGVPFSFNVLDF